MTRPGRSPTVALWIVDLDGGPGAAPDDGQLDALPWTWLDEDERAGAGSAREPEERRRRAASHAALRAVLGAWLGRSPAAVALGRAPCPLCPAAHGRPVLVDHPDRS